MDKEDYVTETIFVKIYNRSKSFRDFVSKKFGEDKNFGASIKFTGANKFNADGYGHPDATSDIGNYIEVKINYNARLTDNEKKGGGYEKYLKENRDKLLLYVVPTYYDLSEAVKVKERVAHLHWQEIVDFLSEQNDTDPLIEKIYQEVKGVDMENKKTIESYKAKVYEVLARVISMNGAVQIDFEKQKSYIKNFPYDTNPYDEIIFTGNVDGGIWFYSANIWLYPISDGDRADFYKNNEKLANKIQTECNVQDGNNEAMKIISQNDFWEKPIEEVALIFNKVILEFQLAYNEIKLNELNS